MQQRRKIVSTDLTQWMTEDRQIVAFKRILEYYSKDKLKSYLPNPLLERLDVLKNIVQNSDEFDFNKINESICLDYIVGDARHLNFPDRSFDFICSNNTFEHVHEDILIDILIEFKRLIKTDGVMSHFIDLSDHFAHMDSSISIYNFLKFSKHSWSLIDNNIQPQNRLRWKDYKNIYKKIGIPIKHESLREGEVEMLKSLPIHTEYENYSLEELAISHGYIVS